MLSDDEIIIFTFLILIWWVSMAAVVGRVASHKGHGAGIWFFLSLFAGPLLALLALIAIPQRFPVSQ